MPGINAHPLPQPTILQEEKPPSLVGIEVISEEDTFLFHIENSPSGDGEICGESGKSFR